MMNMMNDEYGNKYDNESSSNEVKVVVKRKMNITKVT